MTVIASYSRIMERFLIFKIYERMNFYKNIFIEIFSKKREILASYTEKRAS